MDSRKLRTKIPVAPPERTLNTYKVIMLVNDLVVKLAMDANDKNDNVVQQEKLSCPFQTLMHHASRTLCTGLTMARFQRVFQAHYFIGIEDICCKC